MKNHDTKDQTYTERLNTLEHKKWKSILDVQRPYRWNLKRLEPGKTLDIGCGIGRNLKFLSSDSVGIDHNKHSIEQINKMGLIGYLPANFDKSKHNKAGSFDSLLLGHVLEHMIMDDGLELIRQYRVNLRKNGKIIIICPQQKGYASDSTHIEYMDRDKLHEMLELTGFDVYKYTSFPLPRFFGKLFKYNEHVMVGIKNV